MGKIQSPQSMLSASPARPQVFYGFYRREGRCDGILIEQDRGVDVLVFVFLLLVLVEKSIVKLRASKAAILG